MQVKNLTNARYGRLMVKSREGSSKWGNAMWRCFCDCGKETVVTSNNLKSGNVRSCGCLRDEIAKKLATELGKNRKTHGHTANGRSPEYKAWAAMIQRCQNPNDPDFHYYGGRGISVCKKWQQSFALFLNDMGFRPAPDDTDGPYTLDRIDTNGNYEPKNCRWATRKVQARNRRYCS